MVLNSRYFFSPSACRSAGFGSSSAFSTCVILTSSSFMGHVLLMAMTEAQEAKPDHASTLRPLFGTSANIIINRPKPVKWPIPYQRNKKINSMEGVAKSHLRDNRCIILIQAGMKNWAQESNVPQSPCDPKVDCRNVCFEKKIFAKSLYNKK